MTADGVPACDPGEPGPVVVEPPARLTVVAGAAALATAGALLLADAGGRLLLLPALVVAVGLVVRDVVGGPVLRADGRGLEVLSGWRRMGAEWAGVEELRVVKDRRTPVLLVDLGHAVVALSGTRLGRHPQDVLQDLEELRGRGATA